MSAGVNPRWRILVVDDDAAVQKVVKRAAEAAGFEVVQALDGALGLRLATSERFDLVLLDINMPMMDGRDVLRKIKQNPATADVPVLIYSGRIDQLDRVSGLELGADDYLEKPFDTGMLIRKISRLIERKTEERAGK
jgi:DNA-binding response OmpR family regulator